MSARALAALARHEARLRLRRGATLFALAAVVYIGWLVVPDPAGGMALMAVHGARMLYNSSAIAMATASQASMLLGVGGFYLVRGRMGEDVRSGIGAVTAGTVASNTLILAGRWAGNAAYLAALSGAFLLTMFACHLLRGEAPLQPLVYGAIYTALMLPMLVFVSAGALLFDSVPFLMGKAGDVLWFVLMVVQTGALAATDVAHPSYAWPMVFDFAGLSVVITALHDILHTTDIAVGMSDFDAALRPVALPGQLFGATAWALRAGSLALALLPALLAVPLFHRFSPDRVRPGAARARRTPAAVVNALLRPLGRGAAPMYALAARLPAGPGSVLAECGLTIASTPLAALVVLAGWTAAALPAPLLPGALTALLLAWGVCCASLPTRDIDAGLEGLAAAAPGGASAAFTRRCVALWLLGALSLGPVALRLAAAGALRGAATAAGLAMLASAAAAFGQVARTARLFLALFLFLVYIGSNARGVPWLDVVGANGSATPASVLAVAALAAVWYAAGLGWVRASAPR
ncbi:MAG: hypothetical protein ACXU8N_17085 [Telluria sp.]